MKTSFALDVSGLAAGYGGSRVLEGVSVRVEDGKITALLGSNGAGKTTFLRAVSGLIPIQSGEVSVYGVRWSKPDPEQIVKRGIAHVPEGRGTFPNLTVTENLIIGAGRVKRGEFRSRAETWFNYFPRLADRRDQKAGSLSGGEQQMLAVSRAMMSRPKLLLLDEPSMGLAPVVTTQLFDLLGRINAEQGTSMLIVEQNADLVLALATEAFVLESGAVTISGPASELQQDDRVRRAYLTAAA